MSPSTDIRNLAGSFSEGFLQASTTNGLYLIIGSKSSGKTLFLESMVDKLSKEGKSIGGILSKAEYHEDEKASYYVESIISGESKLLCSTLIEKGDIILGKYKFVYDAINFGIDEIINSVKDKEIIVIDEAGPLEIMGMGWRPALEKIFADKALLKRTSIFISLRPSIKEEFIRLFGISEFREIVIDD